MACGAVVSGDTPYRFRCPGADSDDDHDHVLVPETGRSDTTSAAVPRPAAEPPRHPFVRYGDALWSRAFARAHGRSDSEFESWITALDERVAAVDGHGLRVTPAFESQSLARHLGLKTGRVWVKDETGQVAGSHKARHLFGLALALEALEHGGGASRSESDARGLAIASCGNAALAAAVIARACGRPLTAYVPVGANPAVRSRIHDLGASIVGCPRPPRGHGDPCIAAFRTAVAAGAIPFCCQGSENGLAIEGGATLAEELAEQVATDGGRLDRVFVQVGGGALASACVLGFRRAVARGLLPRLPQLHAVQTTSAWPLRRAYDRVRAMLLHSEAIGTASPALDAERARALLAAGAGRHREAMEFARSHRSWFMWPWDGEPRSIASGILDDESYDWAAVLDGTLESGGWPVTVAETRLEQARSLARDATAVPVDATGAAGLAAALELAASGTLGSDEHVAVLFTGRQR